MTALANEDLISFDNILKYKSKLMELYLIHKNLYNQLPETEQLESPIKNKLSELSVLIEKFTQVELNLKDEIEPKTDSINLQRKPRIVSKQILENKGYKELRKKTHRNPKVKNRKRTEDLKKRGAYVHDQNINTNVTKSQKFE